MPAYNAARYIEPAIDSVLSQTFRHLELIVVNDGSTDRTAEIVERRCDRRVRQVQQSNSGVSAARNAGMSIARGDYIALLDADDYWLPNKLDRQLEVLESRPEVGLVLTGFALGDELLRPRSTVLTRDPETAIRRWLLLDGPGVAFSSTALFRRGLLDATGGFDVALSTSADLDFAYRLSRVAVVSGVAEVLAVYRTHQAQMHHDLKAFEHDRLLMFQRLALTPSERRRGFGNMWAKLFYKSLLRRDWRAALSALRRAVEAGPSYLIVVPLHVLRDRLAASGKQLITYGPRPRACLSRTLGCAGHSPSRGG